MSEQTAPTGETLDEPVQAEAYEDRQETPEREAPESTDQRDPRLEHVANMPYDQVFAQLYRTTSEDSNFLTSASTVEEDPRNLTGRVTYLEIRDEYKADVLLPQRLPLLSFEPKPVHHTQTEMHEGKSFTEVLPFLSGHLNLPTGDGNVHTWKINRNGTTSPPLSEAAETKLKAVLLAQMDEEYIPLAIEILKKDLSRRSFLRRALGTTAVLGAHAAAGGMSGLAGAAINETKGTHRARREYEQARRRYETATARILETEAGKLEHLGLHPYIDVYNEYDRIRSDLLSGAFFDPPLVPHIGRWITTCNRVLNDEITDAEDPQIQDMTDGWQESETSPGIKAEIPNEMVDAAIDTVKVTIREGAEITEEEGREFIRRVAGVFPVFALVMGNEVTFGREGSGGSYEPYEIRHLFQRELAYRINLTTPMAEPIGRAHFIAIHEMVHGIDDNLDVFKQYLPVEAYVGTYIREYLRVTADLMDEWLASDIRDDYAMRGTEPFLNAAHAFTGSAIVMPEIDPIRASISDLELEKPISRWEDTFLPQDIKDENRKLDSSERFTRVAHYAINRARHILRRQEQGYPPNFEDQDFLDRYHSSDLPNVAVNYIIHALVDPQLANESGPLSYPQHEHQYLHTPLARARKRMEDVRHRIFSTLPRDWMYQDIALAFGIPRDSELRKFMHPADVLADELLQLGARELPMNELDFTQRNACRAFYLGTDPTGEFAQVIITPERKTQDGTIIAGYLVEIETDRFDPNLESYSMPVAPSFVANTHSYRLRISETETILHSNGSADSLRTEELYEIPGRVTEIHGNPELGHPQRNQFRFKESVPILIRGEQIVGSSDVSPEDRIEESPAIVLSGTPRGIRMFPVNDELLDDHIVDVSVMRTDQGDTESIMLARLQRDQYGHETIALHESSVPPHRLDPIFIVPISDYPDTTPERAVLFTNGLDEILQITVSEEDHKSFRERFGQNRDNPEYAAITFSDPFVRFREMPLSINLAVARLENGRKETFLLNAEKIEIIYPQTVQNDTETPRRDETVPDPGGIPPGIVLDMLSGH